MALQWTTGDQKLPGGNGAASARRPRIGSNPLSRSGSRMREVNAHVLFLARSRSLSAEKYWGQFGYMFYMVIRERQVCWETASQTYPGS